MQSVIDERSEFDVGDLLVRPGMRSLATANDELSVEPLVMQLLVFLSRNAGVLVTRRAIFGHLWGTASVGDDSLNRLVAILRKTLRTVGAVSVTVETVAAAGYMLRLTGGNELSAKARDAIVDRAVVQARDSWRLAWPTPDHLRLETMRHACALAPESSLAHGWMALLCRHAAEYSEPTAAAAWLGKCELSARRSLDIDSGQPLARVALISVSPLYGRWLIGRQMLIDIVAAQPDEPVAAHDLSVLDMATGRVRAAKEIRDRLISSDPFAAVYRYKSVYQNWSTGDHAAMDHAADQAMSLWPMHPAVWMVRLWTLAFTQRLVAARDMVDDRIRPPMPEVMLGFLRKVFDAAINGEGQAMDEAVAASMAVARNGPAHAIASMFAVSLLGRTDTLFDITSAYYFRDGANPIPLHHRTNEPALNEQHRRLTQILFTPVFGKVRSEPRFVEVCERTGLRRYWDESGLRPDFEVGDRG